MSEKNVLQEMFEYFPLNLVITITVMFAVLFFTKSFFISGWHMFVLAVILSILLSFLRAAIDKSTEAENFDY